jgi:uncharacterized membrane protein
METETPDPKAVISPKVIAQAVTSVLLVGIVAAIGAITPELFAGLGAFQGVAFAGVVAIGGALAGYITRDPLRG